MQAFNSTIEAGDFFRQVAQQQRVSAEHSCLVRLRGGIRQVTYFKGATLFGAFVDEAGRKVEAQVGPEISFK